MDLLQNNKPGKRLQNWLGLDYWSNIALLLYIFTMPFVSAFAFTNILSLPLLFSVFLFIIMTVKTINSGKLPGGFFGFDIIFIFVFLFVVIFSFLINGLGNAKSFNHTAAYIATFLFFYLSIKFALFDIKNKKRGFRIILKIITITTIISALYANIEFISSNFLKINLNDYVPRPNEEQAYYDALVLSLFYRARGFTAESGHFTFMMELFSPIAVYYMYFSGFCKWNKLVKAFLFAAVIFSFIFAFSTASFFIVPLALLLSCILYMKNIFLYFKRHKVRFLITTGVISIIFFLFHYFFSIDSLILLSISEKLDTGYDYRQENIDFFFNKFFNLGIITNLIGTGPAGISILGFDESNTILNLYYLIPFELGFLGLLVLLLLFSYFMFNVIKIKHKIGFFLLISLLGGIMHYYFISNFWYPWFWFIGAFAIYCNKLFLKTAY